MTTPLLEQAFTEAAKLPPEDQDALARRWLAEIADEHTWNESLARSPDALVRLADEALAEYRNERSL